MLTVKEAIKIVMEYTDIPASPRAYASIKIDNKFMDALRPIMHEAKEAEKLRGALEKIKKIK